MPRVYEHPIQDAVFAAMQDMGPLTRADLQQMTGLDYNQVIHSLKGLRKKRKIYIAKYTRQEGRAGRCIPHYKAGDAPDAKPLRQLTPKERNERYRERHRARINAQNMARRGRTYDNPWRGLMV